MVAIKAGAKGFDLEEILREYFWQSGYYVVRGVPYKIDDEDVTDVDLWLYERPAASTRRRLIVDIKNKKSPKASERIIWTKGLQAALSVDGSIVATTDTRQATRRLAKTVGVTLLDGEATSKLQKSGQLKTAAQLRGEEFDAAVKKVDDSRRTDEWRRVLQTARGGLLVGFGVQSTNYALTANSFFAEQSLLAQRDSEQAKTAGRLLYLTCSFAAIGLDYILSEQAFRSPEGRFETIVSSIRFGQSDFVSAIPTVRAAIGLARKYAENGQAVSKQIELGFYEDADRIPAEIIAEYAARISSTDALFNVARELGKASSATNLPSFDELSLEGRSFLGVLLDFNGISREKIANAWRGSGVKGERVRFSGGNLELFDPDKPEG